MGLLIHTRRQWFRRLTAAILVVFLFFLSGPVQTQPGAPDPIPRFNETFFPSLASATPAGIADGFGASPRTYRAGEFTFPVRMPLEASLGSMYIGSAVEFRNVAEHGPVVSREAMLLTPYFHRFYAGARGFVSGPLQLRYQASALSAFDPSPGLQQNPGRIPQEQILESDVEVAYTMERAQLRMGLSHRWFFLDGLESDSELWTARMILAYGLGHYSGETESYPMSMLVGLTSHYVLREEETTDEVRDYNTMFVTPGLEIQTRAFSLQATVEVPITAHRTEPDRYTENVRATLGVRYLIR